jgi:hypothetical protein
MELGSVKPPRSIRGTSVAVGAGVVIIVPEETRPVVEGVVGRE